jgi:DNA-binding LytR/AlgR family response regulator
MEMEINYNKQIGMQIVLKGCNTIIIDVTDILYLTCSGNYISFYLADSSMNNGSYMERETLKTYEKKLREYGFFRINRNTLVNGRYILQIKQTSKGKKIYLKGNISLYVSRRKASQLKKLLSNKPFIP